MATQHAIDIAINHSSWQIISDGTNGCSGIVAHTLQTLNTLYGRGKASHLYNLFGCEMQVASTRVIAQTLPQAQHLILSSSSELLYRGPLRHEAFPIAPTLLHLRLL